MTKDPSEAFLLHLCLFLIMPGRLSYAWMIARQPCPSAGPLGSFMIIVMYLLFDMFFTTLQLIYPINEMVAVPVIRSKWSGSSEMLSYSAVVFIQNFLNNAYMSNARRNCAQVVPSLLKQCEFLQFWLCQSFPLMKGVMITVDVFAEIESYTIRFICKEDNFVGLACWIFIIPNHNFF